MKRSNKRLTNCAGTPWHFADDYLLALIPVYLWGIYAFGGANVHFVLAVSLLCSVLSFLPLIIRRKKGFDRNKLLLALTNGLCIGFLMPSDASFLLVVMAVLLANAVCYLPIVMQYIHPIALSISVWGALAQSMQPNAESLLIGSVSPTTPMGSLLDGFLPEEGIYDLLLGRHGGLIGEVSVLMILIGGIYLFFKKRISLMAPAVMLGSLFVISYLFPVVGTRMDFAVAQLFSGGVLFCAVYLLPFYGTKPATEMGSVLYGLLCGVLTYALRRCYSGYDGVFLAVLVSAAITKAIEPYTVREPILWKSEY